MLSLNDKEEEEGPLKPTTRNDVIHEEEEERIPRARSKRARRAPKAVYDNDFEAHEIQNVSGVVFYIIFIIMFCSSSLLLSRERLNFRFRRGGGKGVLSKGRRFVLVLLSSSSLVLLFLFIRMMMMIFKHVKQCEY